MRATKTINTNRAGTIKLVARENKYSGGVDITAVASRTSLDAAADLLGPLTPPLCGKALAPWTDRSGAEAWADQIEGDEARALVYVVAAGGNVLQALQDAAAAVDGYDATYNAARSAMNTAKAAAVSALTAAAGTAGWTVA